MGKGKVKNFFKTVKEHITTILQGFVIGGTMLVPGVSGGTTAMILGIYDKLLSAVGSFTKDIKKNIMFLLFMALGGGLGLVLMASPMEWIIDKFPNPALFFFIGAIAGGIPVIVKESTIKKFSWKIPLDIIIGVVIVLAMRFIPAMDGFEKGSFVYYLVLLCTSMIVAVALVLPGISTSHMLLVLGMYEPFLAAAKSLDLSFLLPLGIGVIIGIFLTTKVLDLAMSKFPKRVYMIILGFVAGSIYEVCTEMEHSVLLKQLPICIITFAAGFCVFWFLSRLESKHEKK
ncbi:MAG: DUF368 domain-containing protein [Clostridia bacterium]|nr:DUF368 domain-containing protein [Clostridia bacterium]